VVWLVVNFELPIAKIFDGISRDKYFNEQFNSYLDDLLKHYRKAVTHLKEAKVYVFFNICVFTFEILNLRNSKFYTTLSNFFLIKECFSLSINGS
jgi:hypothetical protein